MVKIRVMDTLKIKGKWKFLKNKLKKRFTDLTDEDLIYEYGKEDRLIGNIQKKTGETRDAVIRLLTEG